MCVGHPKRHPCQHTSVTYNHCVAARFDRDARLTTPCHNTTYAAPVDTGSKCTNQLCFFEELGGSWVCCRCDNGPNAVGWCVFSRPRTEVNAITGQAEHLTACDHCCCWNCSPYRECLSVPVGEGHGEVARVGLASEGSIKVVSELTRLYSWRGSGELGPRRVVEAQEASRLVKTGRVVEPRRFGFRPGGLISGLPVDRDGLQFQRRLAFSQEEEE